MKITSVIITHEYPDYSNAGGIATFHKHLTKVLAKLNHQVLVLAPGKREGGYKKPTVTHHIDTNRKLNGILEISYRLLRRYAPNLARLLKNNFLYYKTFTTLQIPFDSVIHTEIYHSPSFLIALLCRKKYKFIFHSHGEQWLLNSIEKPNLEQKLIENLENISIKYLSDIVVCCSKDMLEKVERKFPYLKKCLHIPNPIQCNFDHKQEIIDLNLNNILYFGRLEYRKGVDLLIDAFKKINEVNPNAKLYFVGSESGGFYEGGKKLSFFEWYTSQKIPLNIRKNIIFIPQIDNKLKLFKWLQKKAGVVILPARYEPFGYTTLESICLKLPVLCSLNGGAKEILQNHRAIFLIKPDPNDIIKKYTALKKFPITTLVRMVNGNQEVLTCYSYSQVGLKYQALYSGLYHEK